MILSPAVLGRVAPSSWYDAMFGGTAIRQQLNAAERDYKQAIKTELEQIKQAHEEKVDRLEESGATEEAALQRIDRLYERERATLERWLEADTSIERLLADYETDLLQTMEPGTPRETIVRARQRYIRRGAELADAWQWTRDRRAAQLALATLLAMGVVMVIEPLVSPAPGQAGKRAAVRPALSRLKTVRYALLALLVAILLARPTLLSRPMLAFAAMLVAVALIAGLVPLGRKKQNAAE